jgi:hypothetical protein
VALAPEAIAVLIALFALLCCLALQAGWKYSVGALLHMIADVFRSLSLNVAHVGNVGLGFIGDALDDLNNAVYHALGTGVAATEWAFDTTIGWIAYTFQEMAEATAYLAEQTLAGFIHINRHGIGNVVKSYLGPFQVALAWVRRHGQGVLNRLHALEQAVAHLTGKAIDQEIARLERLARSAWHRAATAGAAAIATVLPRFGALERDVSKLEKWVREHAKSLTTAGIVGLVAAAVGALGVGWVRCSKVSRLGRAACGLNENALESLLASALVVASSISIVELAEACQSFTPEVEAGAKFFVRELK